MKEKIVHFLLSTIFTLLVFYVCYYYKVWLWWSPVVMLMINLIFILIQQTETEKNQFKNIIADIVGIFVASLIVLIF